MRRAPARPVRACFVRKPLQRCCPRTWPARDPGAMQRQANALLTLHIVLFTPHTPHFTLALHLNSSHLSSSHLISCLPICRSTFLISPKLVSTHLGSSARQKPWDTDAFTQKSLYKILCTTKLAQSTSQYYFVLHSLHRVLPSSTLHTRLEETPFTSSHLFVTHLNSAVCQKNLVTNRISCAHTFYIVYPG